MDKYKKMSYEKEQIERAEKEHDKNFKMKIKFFGTKNDSKFLSITEEELKKIKDIFN